MFISSPISSKQFPDNFIFGTATSAYQIEGAVAEDGRGPSIWDTFSHDGHGVLNADNGDIACDHYHRWEQDLDMIAALGVGAYRFSIAWPRVFPAGSGQLNQPGIDFYDRLIDGCLQRGLKTFVTLYHWDLPQALADKGGWTNRATAEHFARFAAAITRMAGDRIDTLCTFNEPWCSSILSHLQGIHAPGEKDLKTTLHVIHGQHRAHGLAVQAIRAERTSQAVGIVLNTQAIRSGSDSDTDKAAALRHHEFLNQMFLDPLFKGKYPEQVVAALGDSMPDNWQADMPDIQQALDFWGLNYYTPEYIVQADDNRFPYPATMSLRRENVQRTDIGWEIDAGAMVDMLTSLYDSYELPDCYITENGAAYNYPEVQGIIDDQPRIDYLEAHLHAVQQLLSKEIPIKGYFAWSLMDNFEWAEGYSMRFGIVHVDYKTQKRTWKNSAYWYRDFLSNN